MEPIPAEAFHHQAPRPIRYPMLAAPTVEPAPMLAARNVAKTSNGGRRRPATKKSDAPRTRRPIHSPTASCSTTKAASNQIVTVIRD